MALAATVVAGGWVMLWLQPPESQDVDAHTVAVVEVGMLPFMRLMRDTMHVHFNYCAKNIFVTELLPIFSPDFRNSLQNFNDSRMSTLSYAGSYKSDLRKSYAVKVCDR